MQLQYRKQRGNIAVYAVILVFVSVAAIAVVYKYNSSIEEAADLRNKNTELEGTLKTEKEATKSLAKQNELLNKLLAARQDKRNEIDQIKRSVEDAIKQAYNSDPEARKWGSTPIPQSIIDSVQFNTKARIKPSIQDPKSGKPIGKDTSSGMESKGQR